jgi:PAS domain S-box-containing protein
MIAVLPEQRLAHAVLASIAGVAIAWMIETPFGLLAPAAALFLYARGRAASMLNAALVVTGFGLVVLAARFQTDDMRSLAWSWGAFCLLAFCIGAVVTRAASQNSMRPASHRGRPSGDAADAAPAWRASAGEAPTLSLVHPDERAATAHAAARAFWTGVPQVTRHRQLQADGTYRWTETRSEPGYSVSVDIDDLVTDKEPPTRKGPSLSDDNEAEAIKSARVVETIFGNGWAFDAAGRWIYLHPFAQNSLGVTLEELNAPLDEGETAWKRVLHPDDYDQISAMWRHCLRSGDYFNVEFRFRRANGAYVWARTAARPVRDSDDRITGWFGIALDIDVYKRTVGALRNRERELSQLIDVVPSHLWRLTPDGEPAFFNKRMVDFLGMDVADIDRPGMTRLAAMIEASVHPDDAGEFAETLGRSLETGEPFAMRYRLRRVDGVYRWMSSRAEPMRDHAGLIVHWYGLCHDIDDQLLAEEALRASKRQLEQMLDAVPVNILSFDPAGKMTFASKRYLEQVGAPLGHIQDFDALARDVIHPDDFPAMFARASNGFATGQPFVNRMRRRDSQGVYRWIEARAQPLRDTDGAILQWYVASIDLEDEMRAQEQLRESERMFRQLVENLPAMIDCAGADGEPVYRSRQLREFLGYNLEELDESGRPRLAGTLEAGVHPDEVAAVKAHYGHCLETGEPYIRKHRLRRFDGEYRWVETRAAAMRSAEGAIVQWSVICIDIDSEVRAQEQLRLAQETLARASQAASLAELSASIAHEVNQPLAAIVANSHACQRWLESTPPNLERARITAERITRDANAAAEVVSRIRALFRQTLQARAYSTLEPVVAEVTRWVEDLARKNGVSIAIDVDSALPPISIDKVQIQQVLINLLRNAVEAMQAMDAPRRIDLRARKDGAAVLVEVRDRGCGIEHPEKIFNAFFTTKGSGMGMGLPICRSIVESHGGRLWAENNEDGGATFLFTLPLEMPDAA